MEAAFGRGQGTEGTVGPNVDGWKDGWDGWVVVGRMGWMDGWHSTTQNANKSYHW